MPQLSAPQPYVPGEPVPIGPSPQECGDLCERETDRCVCPIGEWG